VPRFYRGASNGCAGSDRGEMSTHKKIRGCIAASPNDPSKFVLDESYRFFLAAFFLAAILFSSPLNLKSSASSADGARIHFSCIVTAAGLVKKKVNHRREISN
jgi:hypothetical protein